ncbi:MAG TPA: cyclodeaminase/cyclohydrolase family protein [Phycisphaerae bacterium]|nr:cyclodeaminase/cyclohydrolase family protein [Phycisphaerae bacterium]HNU44042.1 cyclodeaminase/cyclohydrolase family protein [Phycisphaerae bacterium]
MDDLTKLPIDEFLDRLAARTPTPGGGAVAAVTAALACDLARMVAAYSLGSKTPATQRAQIEQIALRLQRADALLRPLATADACAYEHMTATARCAKADAAAQPAYQQAVMAAISVPLEVAAVAAGALDAMNELKDVGNVHLLSDLAAAAMLAEAAARVARCCVDINLPQLADDHDRERLRADVDRTIAHAAAHREAVERAVAARLQQSAPPDR